MSKHIEKFNPASQNIKNQLKAYDDQREKCPVAKEDEHTWWVFRHRDIVEIGEDHQTFSNQVSSHLSVPNGMDPPEHTRYRKLIEPYFSEDTIKRFETEFRSIAGELVDKLLAKGEAEIMNEVAYPFAARAQCAFLGWPMDKADRLVAWTLRNQEAVRNQDRHALSNLAEEFEQLVENIMEDRFNGGKNPDDSLTGALMQEKANGRRLSLEELTSIFRNWTVGEVGSLSASVGIIMHHLSVHPDLQERLRSSTERLDEAIDEILRIHGPLVANRRRATCPVSLHGKSIEKGDILYLNWISANRDERAFEEAAHFKWDRNQDKNLLYGKGIHVCPGAPLARMELRILMEVFLEASDALVPRPGRRPQGAQYPASGFSRLPLMVR